MGDTPFGASSWAQAGHRLGALVRDVLEAGHAFLVVSAARGRYVQLHAHPESGCWIEADSGAYSTRLPDEVHRALLAIGWPPVDDTRRPSTNYGLDVEAPVDVYRLVLFLTRTLAQAFDASPEELGHVASACRCEVSTDG